MENKKTLMAAVALLAWPLAAGSQPTDETGVRDNYTLNASGQILIPVQPSNDAAGLVRRETTGADNTIITDGDALGGGTLDGIGAQPHMNINGVAAFQACIGPDCSGGDATDTGMFTGTPGSITEIATFGDIVAGETICNVEPYPLINSANQVFWGSTVEGGDGVETTCDADGDSSGTDNHRKAIYRFTPPTTDALLLLADMHGDGADTVVATGFGGATFTITDVHLIAHGGDAVTSSGNALVTAWLDSDTSDNDSGDSDFPSDIRERKSLLYVTPTTITMVATDDGDGTAPGAGSPFGEMDRGVANASGLVFFKAQTTTGTDAPASLNLWTSGGGMSELVATGDGLPLGPGTFQGFAPNMDLNNSGAGAFTAGLSITSACDDDDLNGVSADPPTANICRGVYYSPDGSSIVEVARTTPAMMAGGTGTNASSDGFEFREMGSVAVLAENATVFFVAENRNPDPECGLPTTGDPLDFGGAMNGSRNSIVGVMAWQAGREPVKVVAEGDILPQGKIMRLFTPMPELRQHEADNDFVIRAWFDTTGNCRSDTDQVILASAIFPGPIPALGPWGMWLLIGVLALLGGGTLLRRQQRT